MTQVSMQQVKELRDRTQAGLNDCRVALGEAEGDMDRAIEIILKRGLAKSAKRAGSVAAEGLVLAAVAPDKRSGVIVEVNIQTDFAAKNQDFIRFAEGVLAVALAAEDRAELGGLPFPGGTTTVEETRKNLVGKLGENINVRRWQRLRVDELGKVHAYVHLGGKCGAIVAARAGNAAARDARTLDKLLDDVAMQTTAMGPLYLRSEAIPEEALAKQREIFEAQLAEEGKPEAARPKIAQGKLEKWKREVCLLEQDSVIEANKSVADVVRAAAAEAGAAIEIVGFVRYDRGEGIAKDHGDFADEVGKLTDNGA